MRQMMKIGVLMPAAVLLVSGCATKDWVREQFTKSDAVIDQRFVKVEGQVEGVSTEVKGVTTQVKSLEGAVADAKNRADAAMTKAEGVDTRLTRLWSNRYNQKTADTLEVYFGRTYRSNQAAYLCCELCRSGISMRAQMSGSVSARNSAPCQFADAKQLSSAVRSSLMRV